MMGRSQSSSTYTYVRVGSSTYEISSEGITWGLVWRTRNGWSVRVGSTLVVEDYPGSRATAVGAAAAHLRSTSSTNET